MSRTNIFFDGRRPGPALDPVRDPAARSRVEDVARKAEIPANLLIAAVEADGLGEGNLEAAALRLKADIGAAKSVRGAVLGRYGDEGERVLMRALTLADELYPSVPLAPRGEPMPGLRAPERAPAPPSAPPAGPRGTSGDIMEGLRPSDMAPPMPTEAPAGGQVRGGRALASPMDLAPASSGYQDPIGAAGQAVGDAAAYLGAGVQMGTGAVVRALGQVPAIVGDYTTTPVMEAVTGRNLGPTPNALAPMADGFSESAAATRNLASEAGQAAAAASTPTGQLFDLSTWSLGSAPTVQGLAMQAAEVFGSMLPIVATAAVTGGSTLATATVGGLQSGGAAAEQAGQAIDQMRQQGTLARESSLYRRLVEGGMDENSAYQQVRRAAETMGMLFAAPVGAVGGALTAKILNPAERLIPGQIAAQVAGRGALGALEEGTQEVAETIAGRTGTNLGAGTNLDPMEGTFGDFVLGALGGGVTGAAAGALTERRSGPIGRSLDTVQRIQSAPAAAPPPSPAPSPPPASSGDVLPEIPGQDIVVTLPDGTTLPAILDSRTEEAVTIRGANGDTLEIPLDEITSGNVTIAAATPGRKPGKKAVAPLPAPSDSADGAIRGPASPAPATPTSPTPAPSPTPSPAPTPAPPRGAASPEAAPPLANRAPPPLPVDIPSLEARLEYLTEQARTGMGWNKTLTNERRRVERALKAARGRASQPATSPEAVDGAPILDGVRPGRPDGAGQPNIAGTSPAQPGQDPVPPLADNAGAVRGDAETAADSGGPAPAVPHGVSGPTGAAAPADAALKRPAPKLPSDLSGAKPRYSFGAKQFDLDFESDLDRAAYIAAQSTPSKRDADYVRFVAGALNMDEPSVRKAGARVRGALKELARAAEPGRLRVPSILSAAPASPVDLAAQEAATSPANALPEPTKAQKEAGNYKKGHVRLAGLDLSIENPAGSERKGVDRGGKPWSVTMKSHYGYIKGTVGKDKDHIDVFVKPGTTDIAPRDPIAIVNQVDPETGKFDEHKVLMGYRSPAEAERAYRENYASDWKGLGDIQIVRYEDFRDWLSSGDTSKPFSDGMGSAMVAALNRDAGEAPASARETDAFKAFERQISATRFSGAPAARGPDGEVYRAKADGSGYIGLHMPGAGKPNRAIRPKTGPSFASIADVTEAILADIEQRRAGKSEKVKKGQEGARNPSPEVSDLAEIDGAYSAIGRGNIKVKVTRDGPWDFASRWPMPDMDQIRALAAEGRDPGLLAADGNLIVPATVTQIKDALYDLVSAIGSGRGAREDIEGLESGRLEPQPGKTAEQEIQSLKKDVRTFEQARTEALDSIRKLWSGPAVAAMEAEARKQADRQFGQSSPPPGAGKAGNRSEIAPPAISDQAPPAPAIDHAAQGAAAFAAGQPRRVPADVLKAGNKAGTEWLRGWDRANLDAPADQPRRGAVGMKLAEGEIVLTVTGRMTTPFPRVVMGTDRKAQATLKRVDQWLMDNAASEARDRNDQFNLRQFVQNRDKPSQADKDSAEEYLFGDFVPDVRPNSLKPLGGTRPARRIYDMIPERPGMVSQAPTNRLRSFLNSLTDEEYATVDRETSFSTHYESNFGINYVTTGGINDEDADKVLKAWRSALGRDKAAPEPAKPTRAARAQAAAPASPPLGSRNTLFTADKVAAARAKLKQKLSQLSAGIDPEIIAAGLVITGAYIEEGIRDFRDYAARMTADLGSAVRPYLLSFWEAARAYPGLDTDGMTPASVAKAITVDWMVSPGLLDMPGTSPSDDASQQDRPLPPPGPRARPAEQRLEAARDAWKAASDGFDAASRAYIAAQNKRIPGLAKMDATEARDAVEAQRDTAAGAGAVASAARDLEQALAEYEAAQEAFDQIDNEERGWTPPPPDPDMADAVSPPVTGPQTEGILSTDALQSAPETQTNADSQPGPETADPRALEPVPAGTVRGPEEAGDAGPGDRAGIRADARPDRRPSGRRPSVRGSKGDGAGGNPVPPSRKPRNPADGGVPPADGDLLSPLAPESPAAQAPEQAAAYTTLDPAEIGKGGPKTKFRQNIAAIELSRTLAREGRPATAAEQAVLARYVGWGGLPQAFERSDGSAAADWGDEVRTLKALLTESEYQAAAASARNAHYTSPEIVQAMWAAMRRLGFDGGKVLEPSVGTGNFFGLMPEDLRSAAALHGVELDPLTGAIAQQLYPGAAIKAPLGFQHYTVPDGYFDAVVGNPPFGSERLHDPQRPDLSKFSIHNYFFARSIDALKPGGVAAMVVTNLFLDAGNDRARAYIAARADLVGAIRLPNDAFLKNAGTQVTTDIIFFRKRLPGEPPGGAPWSDVKSHLDPEGRAVPLNEYFVANPDMMLGQFGAYGTMYRVGDPALIARPGQDTPMLLAAAIAKLPERIATPAARAALSPETAPTGDIGAAKVGSFFVGRDGRVMVRQPDVLGDTQAAPAELEGRALERVRGMVAIRDAFADLRRLQLDSAADDGTIDEARARLNTLYDAFAAAHGPLHADVNKRLFDADPTAPQLLALESSFDKGLSKDMAKKTGETPRPPSAKKAAIFSRRTQSPIVVPDKADTPRDALTISLTTYGRVNPAFMARLTGQPEDDILRSLQGDIFKDPASGAWQPAALYLSGNVKKKLAQALGAAKREPAFEVNVEALRAVQPADVAAIDIDVRFGAHWLPASVVGEFVQSLADARRVSPVYIKVQGRWDIDIDGASTQASALYATDRVRLADIFEAAASQRTITVRDNHPDGTSTINREASAAANEKIALVQEEWKRWVWQDDDRRESLVRLYNDTFNTDALPAFDGSLLTFPGKVDDSVTKLRPSQKNAIWRFLQTGRILLDHFVGAGKTYTGVAAVMEARRMGLMRKPLIVVPNSLVSQWASAFTSLYPNANILAATEKDFQKNNRKRFVARITTGDWDAVIMGHSQFGLIAVSPEAEAAFIKEQIAEIVAATEAVRAADGKKARNIKGIGAQKTKLEERLKALLADGRKDDNIYWDELGVDGLMVDEAHEFKNLAYHSGNGREGIKGLGNPAGSQKAMNLFVKIRETMASTGNRNVIFATGTPISNSMAEMHTLMRYLDYDDLKERGLVHFDSWARVFGEVVSDWELTPAGKYKMQRRFARFVNMPELIQRYRSFADVIGPDDVRRQLAELGETIAIPPVKGGKPQNVVVERSDAQADFIEGLVYRSENLPKGPAAQAKGADNMLAIMSDARKAALDIRLVKPDAGDDPNSKVNEAAARIAAMYRKWDKDRGTQLVFIDLSVPKGAAGKERAELQSLIAAADAGDEEAAAKLAAMSPDEIDALSSSFSVYDDLRQKLIDRGIPAAEIAFIHDANTALQKEELFGKVRSGRVRILMGSTPKMGAGMNVQDRLVALHHLDAPWRPSDLEQREGRIIRQGNMLYDADPEFAVEILRYATKQTLDSMMWQIIEAKARFIQQIRQGGLTERTVEDIGGEAANAAEMKAASSGNPLILQEMTLRGRLRDLETQARSHEAGQHRIGDAIRHLQRHAASDDRSSATMRRDAQRPLPSPFSIEIGGQTFTERAKAGTALILAAQQALEDQTDPQIGSYGGFAVVLERLGASPTSDLMRVVVKGDGEYPTSEFNLATANGAGVIQRIANTVSGLADEAAAREAAAKTARAQIKALEAQRSEWGGAAELAETRQKHRDVLALLSGPSAAGTPKPSIEPDVAEDGRFVDAAALGAYLRSGPLGPQAAALISSGRLVLHDAADTLPDLGAARPAGRIQALTMPNGTIHMVADAIHPRRAQGVLLHEAFHAGAESVLGSAAWRSLKIRLRSALAAARSRALAGETSSHDRWWTAALNRLDRARPPVQHEAEEFAAYAIEEVASAPPGIAEMIRALIGRVKAWALRTFGQQWGSVTPQQLKALAVTALRGWALGNRQTARGGVSSSRAMTSLLPEALTEIDAVAKGKEPDRPITVSMGSEVLGALGVPKGRITLSADVIWKAISDHKTTPAQIKTVLGALDDPAMVFESRTQKNALVLVSDVQTREGIGVIALHIEPVIGRPEHRIASIHGRRGSQIETSLSEGLLRYIDKEKAAALPLSTGLQLPKELTARRPGQKILQPRDVFKTGPKASITEGIFYSVAPAAVPHPQTIRASLRDRIRAATTQAMPTLLATVPLRPLLTEIARDIPSAREYLRQKQAMDTLRDEWHAKTDAVAQKWLTYRVKNRAENTRLMELMHETTIAQVDPSKPFVSHLTEFQQRMLAEGDTTNPLFESVLRAKETDDARRDAWPGFAARFNALSADARGLYVEVRDTYSALADEVDATLLANISKAMEHAQKEARKTHAKALADIRRQGLTGEAAEAARNAADAALREEQTVKKWRTRSRITELRRQFESQRLKGPYFPLSRFGQFFVTVRDGDEVLSFERFESALEQDRRFKALKAEYPKMRVEKGALADAEGMAKAVDAAFVADIEELLTATGADERTRDEVWQRYLRTLPDLSIRKRRIHRQNRAGFVADAVRAFGHTMFHGSYQLARLRYGVDMTAALEDMRAEARQTDDDGKPLGPAGAANLLGGDPVRAGLVVNEIDKRHQFIMNPTGGALAQALTTLGFIYHLGVSPAAAMVNIVQTVIMGVPVLAAYEGSVSGGFPRAFAELNRALKSFAVGGGRAERDKSLTPDERSAMAAAYELGLIERTQSHDLAGVGETGVEYSATRQRVMRAIGWAFHQAERLNREVTFLAAYRMARAKGRDHGLAIDDASDLTWKAHFDYQNSSRPRFMQHDVAKVAFLFKNFTVNMLFRLVRDTHQALHGATKQDRKEALMILGGVTGMMMASAGIRGTWLFGSAMLLAGLFFGGDGEDPEDLMRAGMVEHLPAWIAGPLLDGIPGYALGLDLSERIGMPELWFRSPDRQLEARDAVGYWLEQGGGPIVGIVKNIWVGLEMVADGEVFRGVETASPKFVKDLMRSWRFAQEGALTLKGDDIIERFSPAELIAQATGFTPARLAERYRANTAMKNREQAITDRRSKIMGKMHKALNDPAAYQKALEEAMAFNAEYPDYPITAKSARQSSRQRDRMSERNVGGINLNPKLAERLRNEVAEPLY